MSPSDLQSALRSATPPTVLDVLPKASFGRLVALARQLWLLADTETEQGRLFWAEADRVR